MKLLLKLLWVMIAIALFLSGALHAQSNQAFTQKQIWASDYGTWQVKGTTPNTYQFQPASLCQFPQPAGGTFNAFNVNAPVYLQDSVAGNSEVLTPAFVLINETLCEVALTPVHNHYSFALLSGTAGLQEALNTVSGNIPYAVQVTLDRNWYTALAGIPGQSASAVIAAVKGNTAAILVDTTQGPSVFYKWNGSQYVAAGTGSTPFVSNPGIVYNTSTSASANATSPQMVTALNNSPSTTLAPALFPLATSSAFGVVKPDNSTINIASGIISATLPSGAANQILATPNGSSGAASVRAMVPADMPPATSSAFGAVKPDNSTITVSAGVISVPKATSSVFGVVKPDNSTITSSAGVLTAIGAVPTPCGSNGYVQWNNSGTCGADSTFTFNNSSKTLTIQNGLLITTPATGDNTSKITDTASVFNTQPALLAQYFGAYADGYAQPDGCSTTASNTTVFCNDGVFVSTDVGKQIWVQGAGAAGVAFDGTIVSVTDTQHVVVTPAPSTSVSATVLNNVFGHDDTVAVQACEQYAANYGVQCVLRPAIPPNGGNPGAAGFLIGSAGLTLATNYLSDGPHLTGSNFATNLFCEYNGDCISLPAGPVVSAVVSNLSLDGDPSQPNGRGLHFNAADGEFLTGGLWNSTFTNIIVNNFAQECMWMDGGGGAGYSYNLPNQIDTFIQFQCNGPAQMHTAALIKMTGQAAQILVENGQANGNGPNAGNNSWTDYPNPLIDIEPNGGVIPVDVKFVGYTAEVGTQGIKFGNAAYDDHFDNGYIENVGTPFIAGGANDTHFTFNGNYLANSGNITGIASFTGNATGGMRDTWEWGGGVSVTVLAACSGTGNAIDFGGPGNVIQGGTNAPLTTNCVTSTAAPSSNTLTVNGGSSVSVSADSTPIVTINALQLTPGEELTLYAAGTFTLNTSGNIAFGGYPTPLVVPTGGSVTLRLLDQGVGWLVTSAIPNTVAVLAARKGTFTCTAGGTISIANTNELATSDVVISLNAQGGTISTAPAMKTVTGGTGFSVLCGVADTSTYNYDILN